MVDDERPPFADADVEQADPDLVLQLLTLTLTLTLTLALTLTLTKAWKDVWGAGQGVGAIKKVPGAF